MTLRVTRLNTDVAGLTDPTIRVTKVETAVAGLTDPTLRVTRVTASVAGDPDTPILKLYRFAVHVLYTPLPAVEEEADSSLIFSDTNAVEQDYGIQQNVVFDDEIALELTLEPSATQSLILSQTLPMPPETFEDVAENDLILSDDIVISLHVEVAANSLIFSQYAATTNPTPYLEHVVQTLLLTDTAISSLQTLLATNGLVLSHQALKTLIIEGGLEREASNGLVFSDTATKVKILAGAVDKSATQSLIFTARATLPLFKIAQSGLRFTHTILKDRVKRVIHELVFEHDTSTAGTVRDRTASNGLVFTQAIVWEDYIDTCNYSPKVGTGSGPTPPPSTMPTLTPQNYVRLFYPTVTPTLEVNIRVPEFGNRERLNFMRINRESRGGTLEVFADPAWPKSKNLALTFTGLTEAQAQAVQDFFADTLGLEIGLTDWEGRTWHGIVTTPEADVIRARRGIVDLSFEFEGELQ